MTMRIIRVAAVLSVLALAGCETVVLAPAGPLAVGKDQQVTLGRNWSDVSAVTYPRVKKVKLLTIDGPLLNRLYLTEGLAVGDRIVGSVSKERPTPVVRSGMSATERMEFVADSVAAMDYQRVQTAKPRPAKIGEASGVRFDLTAQTKDGLDIQGTSVVVEQGGKLFVILYLAPAEHYFQAGLAEVEQVMASARIVG